MTTGRRSTRRFIRRFLIRPSQAAVVIVLTIVVWVASASAAVTEKLLHAFTGTDGALPEALVSDSQGNLYGVANIAGSASNTKCTSSVGNGCGTVFELSPTSSGTWQTTVLYRFTGGADGSAPTDLAINSAGNLYGVAQQGGNGKGCVLPHGCGTVFELTQSSTGWKFEVLHSFTGGTDGSAPGALSLDAAGNLYITAQSGGRTSTFCGNGCGTIFGLSSSGAGWTSRTLRIFEWSFTNYAAANPIGRVTLDSTGNLYGAAGGGIYNDVWSTTFGVIYELTPTASGPWDEIVLYDFCPGSAVCTDGANPEAGLTFDSKGNLFGTTAAGGPIGSGTVFELTPSSGSGWTEHVIYTFSGGSAGGIPVSPLIFDGNGNLFGTTAAGGDENCSCGVIFELASVSGGWNQIVLHSFGGASDGANPSTTSGLLINSLGNLYGTTVYGGINTTTCPEICGLVYELPGVDGQVQEIVNPKHGSDHRHGAGHNTDRDAQQQSGISSAAVSCLDCLTKSGRYTQNPVALPDLMGSMCHSQGAARANSATTRGSAVAQKDGCCKIAIALINRESK